MARAEVPSPRRLWLESIGYGVFWGVGGFFMLRAGNPPTPDAAMWAGAGLGSLAFAVKFAWLKVRQRRAAPTGAPTR